MPNFQISTTITETYNASPNRKIDPSQGVIENVKLIGFQSKNGRVYPPEVLAKAVEKYEGAKVNINHPAGNDPTHPRAYQDRFSVIRNARFVEGQGIFGDCHFNPKHPYAAQICWDATHHPDALGFSHNALLRLGSSRDGQQMIEEIIDVRSMDLVADPATTTSLFEQLQPQETNMDPTKTEPNNIETSNETLSNQTPANDKQTSTLESLTSENEQLKRQLAQYQQVEQQRLLTESIHTQVREAGLNPDNPCHVSALFIEQLQTIDDEKQRANLIADRAALILESINVDSTQPNSQPRYTPSTSTAIEQIDTKEFARRLLR